MTKYEFSKLLIIVDYIFMVLLVILSLFNESLSQIAIAWIAQVGISSGFYYWKAKNENRIKIPVEILRSLTKEEKDSMDITQIITSVIDKE